jgi:hypothetical protein
VYTVNRAALYKSGLSFCGGLPATYTTPEAILSSPLIGYTYKLPPRTVGLIEELIKDYGTRGNVLAAVAAILSAPEPRRGAFK